MTLRVTVTSWSGFPDKPQIIQADASPSKPKPLLRLIKGGKT